MGEIILSDMAEAWLNRPRHAISMRFPALLERQFEQDTRRERSMMLSASIAGGFCTGLVLFLAIMDVLPDRDGLGRLLFLGFGTPLGFVIAALVRLDVPPALRESLTTLASVALAFVATTVFAFGGASDMFYFFAGITIMLIYSAVGVQLRFGYAVFACASIVVVYAAGLEYRGVPGETRRNLILLASTMAAYLLLANWRLERELRRNYLVGLRDRLQRQHLSVRNRELDELARCDPLTDLANRRAYDAWLQSSWQQARLLGGRIGLVVVDVDCFKDYNDFYGHAAGDRCLQVIAHCLRDQLRGTTDLVARLGGEEFAVLLPGLEPDTCADVAERIRGAVEALELPHLGRSVSGMVTVSAGVASLVAEASREPGALFVLADAALYQAKQTGRNRVCVAAPRPLEVAAQAVTL